jgi:hypothetical protein
MVFSIFHIFKALLINEGENDPGRNDSRGEWDSGAKRPGWQAMLIDTNQSVSVQVGLVVYGV